MTTFHVLPAMKESARHGFWNGALPPIGYRKIEAEKRGAKIKKKLEINPIQAETVQLIYRLALRGYCDSDPAGLKTIAKHLNERDVRTRDGGRCGIAAVNQILTRTTYIGEHRFNTYDSKAKRPKPNFEHVVMEVPAIVTKVEWQAVQAHLKPRNPKWTGVPANYSVCR